MKRKFWNQSLLCSLALLSLAGCGSSKMNSGSTDLASRSTVNTGSNTTSNGKAYAYCNEAGSLNSNFKAHLAVYRENSSIRNDLMYLKLSSIASSFSSTTNYFQFFRWQANTSTTYLDPTALKVRIINSTGQEILSSRNYLRWSDLTTAATAMSASTPDDFFNQAWIIVELQDSLGQYDVLKSVYYSGTSNTQLDVSDALLPVFNADPAGYATDTDGTTRNQLLRNLHPFASKTGQSWSLADFQTYANALCQKFQ